jgi:hypothetical protein
MFWGATSQGLPSRLDSAKETAKATFTSEAVAAGLLFIDVPPPRSTARGRLALFVEGAIERGLETRGAPPPRVMVIGFDQVLSDQLERARISGALGIALWFSALDGIAVDGALDSADSSTVRAWVDALGAHPILLEFAPENGALGIYSEPEPLSELIAGMQPRSSEIRGVARDAAPTDITELTGTTATLMPPAPFEAASALDAMDVIVESDFEMDRDDDLRAFGDDRDDDDRDDDGEFGNDGAAFERRDDAADSWRAEPALELRLDTADSLSQSARAMADDTEAGWLRDALLELSTPAPRETRSHDRDDSFFPSEPMPKLELRFADPEPPLGAIAPPMNAPVALPETAKGPVVTRVAFVEPVTAPAAVRETVKEPVERPALDGETRRKLQQYARDLDAAHGPKPLSVVERLFTSAYVPLRAALDRGVEVPELRETADEWATNFEKSYTEAFDALRVRNKRPLMVVDVPDIALRVARLHGARTTQLLLVDGMRFDLGDAVNDALRGLVGKRAACAERFLLWAALPTTTATQVELIGRGAAGLREFTGEVSEDMMIPRGKKASMIRRLKTGHREVHKLDMIEARLAEPGGASPDGFGALAHEVAERIAAHFEEREPRTLVMVFGDHGFAVERKSDAFAARQGGASPEEVLVPAFAWLCGAVH